MRLTREQERLARHGTRAQRLAMRILVGLGEVSGARDLVSVKSAHISGVSYKMIGDAGLEFLETFAKTAKVVVPTTVNPMGMDPDQWKAMGVPASYARKQLRIANAYRRMGVAPSFSCTPYLLSSRPRFGEHLAWAESSAVCFANSAVGARTNREGGPSALASAVTGWTPRYGMHLAANRRATCVVKVRARIDAFRASLLGLHVGAQIGDGLPYFEGFRAREGILKWLGAGLSSSGTVSMFHLARVTPEWRRARPRGLPAIRVTEDDLMATAKEYTDARGGDILAVGSPQVSREELRSIARLVTRFRPKKPVWVFASRAVRDAELRGVAAIEATGGRVLVDTCLEVTVLEHLSRTVVTPSGKAAYYLPTLCSQRVVLEDFARALERFS